MLKVGDYVVAVKSIKEIPERAVGLVKEISGKEISVFFIGAGKDIKTDEDHIQFLDIHKTGKPYDKKICNICHLLKDNDEFEINQTDAKGRKTTRPSCRECRVAINGAPMLISEKRRMDKIVPKGIFRCPLCGKTSIVGVTANLVKDHDHVTGKAREWICDSCNTGLGRFKDDVKLLQRAIDYLNKYNSHKFSDA